MTQQPETTYAGVLKMIDQPDVQEALATLAHPERDEAARDEVIALYKKSEQHAGWMTAIAQLVIARGGPDGAIGAIDNVRWLVYVELSGYLVEHEKGAA